MITVNGKKVAGVGPAGLSPYQVAVSGGYSGTEEEFNETLTIVGDLNSKLDEINGEVVGTTSVEKIEAISDGKSTVAAAITAKGVETAADATFQQMAANIGQIETGGATATLSINLSRTFDSFALNIQTPNGGLIIETITTGQTYTISVPSIMVLSFDSSKASMPPSVIGDVTNIGLRSYELGMGVYFDVESFYVTGNCSLAIGD